ncbi:hypothetical protein [Streptomyces luteogriseus]|uniref:hypothetical protein n=1 Tax=Streptomyces luteogriseus TaxID=68233 RepID=UPI0037A61645
MKLLDEPVVNQYGHIRYAEDADHYYECWPMGFNERLVLLNKADVYGGYTYGWCFERTGGLLVKAALLIWEPEMQDEPQFWHKRAGPARRAPQRGVNPMYNRDRCVHGSYMDAPCERDQFCAREGN